MLPVNERLLSQQRACQSLVARRRLDFNVTGNVLGPGVARDGRERGDRLATKGRTEPLAGIKLR